MKHWLWLKQYGVLPYGLSRDEQDPRFVDAVDLIEVEVSRQLMAPLQGVADGLEG